MTSRRFVFGLLVLSLAVAYGNVFTVGFELDDPYLITVNPMVRSWRNLPEYLTNPHAITTIKANADLRPVLGATYVLNYAISGLHPWSWHLLSLLIHLGCAWLVFLIVREHLWVEGGDLGAGLAALAFALAPLNGSPAAQYMSARSASLATLFYLVAFREALRERYGRMAMAHALALGAKAIAVTLPGALVLYALVYRRRPWRALVLPLGLSVWLDVLYLGYRAVYLPSWTRDTAHSASVTPWVWLLSEFQAYIDYARRFVWPSDLSIDHQSVFVTSLEDPRAFLPLLGILAAIGLGLLAWSRWPVVTFAIGWYLLTLAPESTLIPLAETQNDHRPYLASALGLAPLVAWGLNGIRSPVLGAIVTAALLFGAVVVTHDRNVVWQNTVTLWRATTVSDPDNGRAWMNAGVGLMAKGELAESRRYILQAKALYPRYAFVEFNLSVLDRLEGNKAGAVAHGREGVRLVLDDPAQAPNLDMARHYLDLAEKMP